MNLLNALDPSGGVSMPGDFRLIRKPLQFCDVVTRQVTRMSEVTKQSLWPERLLRGGHHRLKLRYLLMDSWFAAKDTFE